MLRAVGSGDGGDGGSCAPLSLGEGAPGASRGCAEVEWDP